MKTITVTRLTDFGTEEIQIETGLLPDYKLYKGPYTDSMPQLIAEGFRPLTIADIIRYKIKALKSQDWEEIDFWLNTSWPSCDAIIYFNNNAVIISNSDILRNINNDQKFDSGKIMDRFVDGITMKEMYPTIGDKLESRMHLSYLLTEEEYKELVQKYGVLDRDQIVLRKNLTKKQAKIHPLWLGSAQDKNLLDEFVERLFEYKERTKDRLFCPRTIKLMPVMDNMSDLYDALPRSVKYSEITPQLNPLYIAEQISLGYNFSGLRSWNFMREKAILMGVK